LAKPEKDFEGSSWKRNYTFLFKKLINPKQKLPEEKLNSGKTKKGKFFNYFK
jgi:hypothetical protein